MTPIARRNGLDLAASAHRTLPSPYDAQRQIPWVTFRKHGWVSSGARRSLMFGEPLFFASRHVRAGNTQLFSEFIATFGFLSITWGCARRSSAVPFAVGAYITGAYWFTSSTSFANPAVTLARAASDTFAGIRPADAPGSSWRSSSERFFFDGWCLRFRRPTPTSLSPTLKKRPAMPDKKRILLRTGNSATEPDGRRPHASRRRRSPQVQSMVLAVR
jgi:hypothetical protein